MKQVRLLLLLTIFALQSGMAQTQPNNNEKPDQPLISFEKTTLNLGQIQYDDEDTYWFKFNNSGTKPLILTSVVASCGCVAPLWPKAPIRSGQADSIKVIYDTRSQGNFSKSIRVYSNAKNSPVILWVKGKVMPKDH